jgi:CPA2 family monovalent cation:H+ antiporter-2
LESSFDLTTLALIVVAALGCGLLLIRFRQPVVVGYIIAGVILGPSVLGLVTDREQVSLIAELGVLLLLFVIGLEVDLRAFRRVYQVAVLTMLMQALGSVAIMLLLSHLLGWSIGLAILIGFSFALSSTAVAIKMLEDTGELKSDAGRITVGILIAQDLAVIPMLLIVGGLAGDGYSISTLFKLLLAVGVLAVLIRYLSNRDDQLDVPLLRRLDGNTDIAVLAAVAVCFAVAALAGFAGLSPAYGAFLAGLFFGNTRHGAAMLKAALPVQSLFIAAFFLSIGLLIDLQFIWDNLLQVMVLLLLVTVVKTAVDVGILRLLGQPWPRAFYVGVVIGQIGEFSFLLVAMGTSSGIVDQDVNRLLIAVIALSLVISPLWFSIAKRLQQLAAQSGGGIGIRPIVYGVVIHQRRTTRLYVYIVRRRLRTLRAPHWTPRFKR